MSADRLSLTARFLLAVGISLGLTCLTVAQSETGQPAANSHPVMQVSAGPESPRAAMFQFLAAMDQVEQRRGTEEKRALAWRDIAQVFGRPDDDAPRETLRQQAFTLDAILDKLGTIKETDLPSAATVNSTNLGRFVFFPGLERHREIWTKLEKFDRWPEGQIVLVLDDAGYWRFSDQTLASLDALARSMEPLPPQHLEPALMPSTSRVANLLGPSFEKTPLWGWGALLGLIFIGLAIGKIAQASLRSIGRRLEDKGWSARATAVGDAASPVSLACLTVGLMIGLELIFLQGPVAELAWKVICFLYLLAAGWFLYNLVDVIDVGLRRLTEKTESQLDDQIVPLIRKTLRVFLVVVFSLVVAQNVFGVNITGWLAGLGIAGLAVSLAAQDSVKNLFGSVTVFFDRPFIVGDFVVFDGYSGTVEEIGFR
ncbi:MAG: mechanosensitive ion channel, partial [Phycisphaeraceae bacterium]|nr:mechanosensitive ion channel [Phycisphaeraceae bacterium]